MLDAQEYSSPAFIKRARVSYGSLYEGFDIFEEDGGVRGKGRKRTRFGRDSSAWRYSSQSPTPEPDEQEEIEATADVSAGPSAPVTPAKPSMMDEGCQTMELGFNPTSSVHQPPSSQLPYFESQSASVERPPERFEGTSTAGMGTQTEVPPQIASSSTLFGNGPSSHEAYSVPRFQAHVGHSAFVSPDLSIGDQVRFAFHHSPIHRPYQTAEDVPEIPQGDLAGDATYDGVGVQEDLVFASQPPELPNEVPTYPPPPENIGVVAEDHHVAVWSIDSQKLDYAHAEGQMDVDAPVEAQGEKQTARELPDSSVPTPDADETDGYSYPASGMAPERGLGQPLLESGSASGQPYSDVEAADDEGREPEDEAEYEEDNQAGDDYDLRDYADNADDEEGFEDEEEREDDEEEVYDEDGEEYEDEEEGYDDEYGEEYDDGGHQYPHPPQPPAQTGAPVVIDLISDSEDEEFQPPAISAPPQISIKDQPQQPEEPEESEVEEYYEEEDEEEQPEQSAIQAPLSDDQVDTSFPACVSQTGAGGSPSYSAPADEGEEEDDDTEREETGPEAREGAGVEGPQDEEDRAEVTHRPGTPSTSAVGDMALEHEISEASLKADNVPEQAAEDGVSQSDLHGQEAFIAGGQAPIADFHDASEGGFQQPYDMVSEGPAFQTGATHPVAAETWTPLPAPQVLQPQDEDNSSQIGRRELSGFMSFDGAMDLSPVAPSSPPLTQQVESQVVDEKAIMLEVPEQTQELVQVPTEQLPTPRETLIAESTLSMESLDRERTDALETSMEAEMSFRFETAPQSEEAEPIDLDEAQDVREDPGQQLDSINTQTLAQPQPPVESTDSLGVQEMDDAVAIQEQLLAELESASVRNAFEQEAPATPQMQAHETGSAGLRNARLDSQEASSDASSTTRRRRGPKTSTRISEDKAAIQREMVEETTTPTPSIAKELQEKRPTTRSGKSRTKPAQIDSSIQLARASLSSKRGKRSSDTAAESPQTPPRDTRTRSRSIHTRVTPDLEDTSVQLAKAVLRSQSAKTDGTNGSAVKPKEELGKLLRSSLPDFTALTALRSHINKNLDVVAVAASSPSTPQRVKSRQFMMTLNVTDPSLTPSGVVEVQFFRAHKESLPIVRSGDAVLLRAFTVLPLAGKALGLRTHDSSSWAIFDREDGIPQIRGPPVEVSDAEAGYVALLKEWFAGLGEAERAEIEKASAEFEKQ